MTSESISYSQVMQIRTKEDWDKVLLGGAVVLWETKYFKIFRMADGSTWRVMPQWRMAWPFAIDNGTMDEIIF